MEEKFEEAYDIGIDSASEELEYTGASRRIIARESRDDPEAGMSSRDDEEGLVKAPVTAPRYRVRRAATAEENMAGLTLAAEEVFEDSKEEYDGEKIVEVDRELSVEVGEDEGNSLITKKELPKGVTRDRAVLESPAHLYTAVKADDPKLPALKSDDGGVDRRESNTRGFVRGNFSGDEGYSDADAEDESDETNEDDGEGDGERGEIAEIELANVAGRSGECGHFAFLSELPFSMICTSR